MTKKVNYIKKTVRFQDKELVMFSIDGDTWSTRKEELLAIIERHEFEKQNFGGQIKGGPQAKSKIAPSEDDIDHDLENEDLIEEENINDKNTKKANSKKPVVVEAKAKAIKIKPTAKTTVAKISDKNSKKNKAKLPEPKSRIQVGNNKKVSKTKKVKKVA